MQAGGELRNSQTRESAAIPMYELGQSGGSAPANMGGEPPDGRAKGRRVEISSPPPEETLAPSVLAHVNDPA